MKPHEPRMRRQADGEAFDELYLFEERTTVESYRRFAAVLIVGDAGSAG